MKRIAMFLFGVMVVSTSALGAGAGPRRRDGLARRPGHSA